MDSEPAAPRPPSKLLTPNKNRRKRIRVFTPDDRASHRVVEKQRREALNERFIELARLLPGLSNSSRLSKSIIVNESIAHHRKQRAARLTAAREIRLLLAERNELLAEVNQWRSRFNPVGAELRHTRLVNDDALDVLNVESEEFGEFPNGFGVIRPSDEEADVGYDGEGGGGVLLPSHSTEMLSETAGSNQLAFIGPEAGGLPPEVSLLPFASQVPVPLQVRPAPGNSRQSSIATGPQQMDTGTSGPSLSRLTSGGHVPLAGSSTVTYGNNNPWDLLGSDSHIDIAAGTSNYDGLHSSHPDVMCDFEKLFL